MLKYHIWDFQGLNGDPYPQLQADTIPNPQRQHKSANLAYQANKNNKFSYLVNTSAKLMNTDNRIH